MLRLFSCFFNNPDNVLCHLCQYLVSVPLKMFRLWAFLGMMAQVSLKCSILLVEHQIQFSFHILLPVSDPAGLFCGPLLEGKLRQRRRLDVADHWPADRRAHVRPRLLRAALWECSGWCQRYDICNNRDVECKNNAYIFRREIWDF